LALDPEAGGKVPFLRNFYQAAAHLAQWASDGAGEEDADQGDDNGCADCRVNNQPSNAVSICHQLVICCLDNERIFRAGGVNRGHGMPFFDASAFIDVDVDAGFFVEGNEAHVIGLPGKGIGLGFIGIEAGHHDANAVAIEEDLFGFNTKADVCGEVVYEGAIRQLNSNSALYRAACVDHRCRKKCGLITVAWCIWCKLRGNDRVRWVVFGAVYRMVHSADGVKGFSGDAGQLCVAVASFENIRPEVIFLIVGVDDVSIRIDQEEIIVAALFDDVLKHLVPATMHHCVGAGVFGLQELVTLTGREIVIGDVLFAHV